MILSIISISLSVLAIGCSTFVFFLNKKTFNSIKLPQINQIGEIQENTLINDLLSYTFDKELKCTVMPGLKDQLTLFAQDEEGNSFPITTISVSAQKDSEEYTGVLKSLTDEVDSFISNNKMKIYKSKLEGENVNVK
jgi:hypothetical protein